MFSSQLKAAKAQAIVEYKRQSEVVVQQVEFEIRLIRTLWAQIPFTREEIGRASCRECSPPNSKRPKPKPSASTSDNPKSSFNKWSSRFDLSARCGHKSPSPAKRSEERRVGNVLLPTQSGQSPSHRRVQATIRSRRSTSGVRDSTYPHVVGTNPLHPRRDRKSVV